MRTNNYLIIFIFLLFSISAFTQSEFNLLSNWDYKRNSKGYEKINKVIATTNGYVIAVGETLGDSYKDLDGLFLVINATDGSRYQWKKFGSGGNEAFHSVVQNHDGTFTLVGYTQKGPKGDLDGWVVQLDIEGNKLFEATPKSSHGGDDELIDVAINLEGDIMATGQQTADKMTSVWTVQIGQQEVISDNIISNASLGTVKGLTAATDGGFVLVGNTSSKNKINEEDIWALKVDKAGNDQWGGVRYFGGKGFQECGSITPTVLDGGFAIVGTTNAKGEGMTDMWLVKIDERGELEWDKTYGGHAADVGRDIIELSEGGFAIFGQTWSHMPRARNATLNLFLTDPRGFELESETYLIIGGEGDEVAYSIVELLTNDNLVIAGNTQTEKTDIFPTTYLGAITYKTIEAPGSSNEETDRFGASLSEGISISSAVLVDANKNNFLELNERGYLEVEVTNANKRDLFNVSANVNGNGNPTELGYWEKIQLGALKAGQKKKLFVPVYARGALTGGTYQLNISLDVNGTYAASSTASVKSNQPNPAYINVQGYTFTPNAAPQAGQRIQLTVDLINTGGLPSAPISASFSLPAGVKAMDAQTVNLSSLRPGQKSQVSFSFAYDKNFQRNVIDVVFQTNGQQVNNLLERFSLEVKPSTTPNVTAMTNPKNNTRNMGDMMVWMSHDPDEKGTRTFATNKRDVDIKLKILTSRQLEKNKISVYINGNKHQGQKMDEVKLTSEGSSIGRYNYQNKLLLREGTNKVRVVYHDENGQDFSSDELIFDYSPKDKPNLYVLSIGVKHQDLEYTVKDAKDFARMYGKLGNSKDRRVFRKVEVFEVTADEMTTANNIKAAFIRLGRMNIKDGDLVVIFISSHGKINNSGDFILIPSDYNSELEELYSVNFKEDILKKLRMVDGNKLVFIDACHSGSALSSGSRSFSDAASSKVMNDLIRASSGLEIIASCGDNEYSYEDKSWGNGAFTKSILEAFNDQMVDIGNGKKITADIFSEKNGIKDRGKDKVITIEELKLFIQQRVPYLVRSTKVAPPTEQRPSNKSTDLLPKEMGIFVVNANH